MTLMFILFTSPGAVSSIMFNILIQTETGRLILVICDNLTFSYHGFNIIILSVSNKNFWRKLNVMLRLRPKDQFKTTITKTDN